MNMKLTRLTNDILQVALFQMPDAIAQVNSETVNGTVEFYDYFNGTLMLYELMNLSQNTGGIFGFHVHEGKSCLNDTAVPYEKTGAHLNPDNQNHPYHLGDLPPVFANDGYAWGLIYIDKFQVKDINQHTLVLHEQADDLHSQPSGHSGTKIACGEIYMISKEVK